MAEGGIPAPAVAGGSVGPAGNRVKIVLKKMPGHPRGYIVYTAFPV